MFVSRASVLLMSVLICCVSTSGNAEDVMSYPNRPIQVIVPTGAGAGVDVAARITAAAVEKYLGQRLVIENKPGAGQRLGAAMVARSPADGYTLLFSSPAPIVVAEHLSLEMSYEPARDFRPVTVGVFQPALLIVRPTLGVKSVDEFVAYAKGHPGKVMFGVQGVDSEMYLSLKLLEKSADINVAAIPYNAAGQAIVDLLADRLDAMFLVLPPVKSHLESGKLLALATLNNKRIAVLPSIPTMAEVGRPEMTNAIWYGYTAPAKTPDAIIEKLAHALAKVQTDETVAKRLADLGAELSVGGPAAFGQIIERDRARYGKIAAEINRSK